MLVIKYCLHDEVEEDEVDGAHGTHRELIEVYEVLVVKFEGKTPYGRPSHRWEDNILNMNLKEMGSELSNWVHLSSGKVKWWAELPRQYKC